MKTVKIIIFIALIALAVGVCAVTVGILLGGSFEKEPSAEVTHYIDEPFSNITAEISSASFIIQKSETERAYAVCDESRKITYNVSLADNTLYITENDNRAWYDYIGIHFSKRVVLYLPEASYGELKVKSASGNISSADKALGFSSASLSAVSGNIDFASALTGGNSELSSNSGNIKLIGAEVAELKLSSVSGGIKLEDIKASVKIAVNASSGSISVYRTEAPEITLDTASGRICLEDTIAGGKLNASCASGNISLLSSDAPDITLRTSSGEINADLLTAKLFEVKTTSGNIDCPPSVSTGGKCTAQTSSGDIKITIDE